MAETVKHGSGRSLPSAVTRSGNRLSLYPLSLNKLHVKVARHADTCSALGTRYSFRLTKAEQRAQLPE
jgi:hypothetical protein